MDGMSQEEIEIVARAIDPMAWTAHAYGAQDINLYAALSLRRERSRDTACVALVALAQHRAKRPFTRADYDAAPVDGWRYSKPTDSPDAS